VSKQLVLDSLDYEAVIDCYQANLDSKAELSKTGLYNDLAEYSSTDFANTILTAIENEVVIVSASDFCN
jgi:hypothetical protein